MMKSQHTYEHKIRVLERYWLLKKDKQILNMTFMKLLSVTAGAKRKLENGLLQSATRKLKCHAGLGFREIQRCV